MIDSNCTCTDVVIDSYDSPCGKLWLGTYRNCLCMCDWKKTDGNEENKGNMVRSLVYNRIKKYSKSEFVCGTSPIIEQAKFELDEYFSLQRVSFSLPLLFIGTDFQKTVWHQLMNIPIGDTISYAEIARRMGKPNAVRAVANSIGANALSIMVPCHRVLGADGSLTGYAGGLEAKRFLLNHEKLYLLNEKY